MRAKKLLISFFIHIIVVSSENCGIKNSPEWPWSVSLFYDTSNLVLCQGTIISDRHVLTAGHCLQHKNPSSVLVYPGLLFYRPHDDAKGTPWQLEQINLHPDMKLTSHGSFINGGFVASMEIHADLAIGTLKQVIQFNDTISSVCLSNDKTVDLDELLGKFSGWDSVNKSVENFNSTIDRIDDEIFKIPQEKRSTKIIEGTGIYEENNSSWSIIGVMTMNEFNSNGTENIQFINLHMFANWITNFLKNSSSNSLAKTSTMSSALTSSTVSLMGENMSTTSIESSTLPNLLSTLISSAGNASSLVSDAVAKLKSRLLPFSSESTTTSNTVSSNGLAETSTSTPTQTTNSIASIATAFTNMIEKLNFETSTATASITTLSTEAVKSVTENNNSITTTGVKIESNKTSKTISESSTTKASVTKNDDNSSKTLTTVTPAIESSTKSEIVSTTSNIPSTPLFNNTDSKSSINTTSKINNISTLPSIENPKIINTTASYKTTERTNSKNLNNANTSTTTSLMSTESSTIETEIDSENSILASTETGNDLKINPNEIKSTGDISENNNTTISIITTTPPAIKTLLPKLISKLSTASLIENLNETTTTVTEAAISTTSRDNSLHINATLSTNKPLSALIETLSSSTELPPVTENIPLPVSIASKMSEKVSNLTTEAPKTRMSQGRSLDLNTLNDTISSTLNSTMVSQNITETQQNSTMSDEEQPLLASTGLDPAVLIAIVFIGSVILLFIIFCALGSQKPTPRAH
ncbi:hypothetical protein PVAND_001998 [Polypedilum vanderplanki]|uniref:Peptidase S1 domain-containing protein n=1 Tax=Polypedilum vanderplanki TaxID=319348 RepID=A0A9J6BQ11_POLVA|nr:hypothetical protein PVAND_001998 [Polypedilum vanderplanki]